MKSQSQKSAPKANSPARIKPKPLHVAAQESLAQMLSPARKALTPQSQAARRRHSSTGLMPASEPARSSSSSLLSRRLQRFGKDGMSKTGPPRVETLLEPPKRRAIRWCESISDHYTLGPEVMPSVHRDMEVLFATSPSGEEVVVKVRYKKGSFRIAGEERAWRASTEMMLNLPNLPGIAHLHDVLEDKQAFYVVMEKVAGLDLFETLLAEGQLPVEEAKEVLRQLLDAVAELHDNGCIHKDLKLENVMYERRPSGAQEPPKSGSLGSRPRRSSMPVLGVTSSVKLIDFDTVEEWSPKSPKAADVLGTDQYIAPEAYEGNYSPASDMFAVGVIGYRLFTGSFPFRSHIFDDQPGENWVGSPKMKEIKDRLHGERINWDHPVFHADRSLQHVLARLLSAKETLWP